MQEGQPAEPNDLSVRRALIAAVGIALLAGPIPAVAGPTDPDDETPYWVVGTRRADALAAVLA